MVGIQHHVVPPEENVVNGDWLAIGPLKALAEVESPLAVVLVGVPTLTRALSNVQTIVDPAHCRMPVLALCPQAFPVVEGAHSAPVGTDLV